MFQVSTSSDSSQNVAPKHLRSSEGLFAAPPSVVAGGSSSSSAKVGGPSTTSTEDPGPTSESDEAAHQPADPREEGDPAGRGAVEVAPAQGEDTPEDGLESLSVRGEQAAGGAPSGSKRKAPNGPVREDDDMVELGKNEPKIIFDEATGTILNKNYVLDVHDLRCCDLCYTNPKARGGTHEKFRSAVLILVKG